ncbi:hypothetical protein RclHR1_00430026 [Rhizophagus clarus]|uniref:Uncharacterized protein n=1 Tax=Rhizophagus clarus TaxID=94130 RepID=A0A2Z6SAW7_9GLOM|nr:hypothetical protein RclHR1_00430026 [Rhizophagus clarus]GES83961.1 hypothetical protein RCL_jg19502.t1 [Rhizophagus clarus]
MIVYLKCKKLKTVFIDDRNTLNGVIYYDLEILKIEQSDLNVISSIVEHSGGRLEKILFKPYDAIGYKYDMRIKNFYEDSLKFIRNIHENCLN